MNINKKRGIKGITLVSLVITIIVMLILAGVAINLTIDSNGLFGKANTAGNKWNNSVENERSELQDLLGMVDVINVGWDINKIGSIVTETSTITGTTKERTVPIPKGYVASGISTEATIAGGLVIYEMPTGATVDWINKKITIDGTTSNLQEAVNQYVWIPVDDINYMVMCKSNNKVADESGNKTCNLALIDGILQCTNTAHSATATELCGRLYSTDSITTDEETPKTYTTNMQFTDETRASQTWNTRYREPDIIIGTDGISYDGDDSNLTGIGYSTTANKTVQQMFLGQLTDDFKNMATSVAKYGGFYVSRYEAGENGASKKKQKVITALGSSTGNYIGVNTWYGLYRELHREIAVGTSTIQSHMIYGSQYDQIINFLETNSNNEPQIGHTGRQLATRKLTGSNEADVMSNIYDLEGNNIEWICQAALNTHRNFRGGDFYNAFNNKFYSASYRSSNTPNDYCGRCSSRASLYL